ncbi:unnamed protein product [Phytophthora fragariaefolia]|uniref:Unnamed protein product n=1 Tax=Phytophthora fragariaefolia TaxID=1490495 RepID=A0A9W6XQ70_9STRA|nr:unnamed protein product [Phytophthora fragariaefolia]
MYSYETESSNSDADSNISKATDSDANWFERKLSKDKFSTAGLHRETHSFIGKRFSKDENVLEGSHGSYYVISCGEHLKKLFCCHLVIRDDIHFAIRRAPVANAAFADFRSDGSSGRIPIPGADQGDGLVELGVDPSTLVCPDVLADIALTAEL